MNTIKPPRLDFSAVVRPTAFVWSPRLNARTALDITLASETFQLTGSFKFRAAYNLASGSAAGHLITASSGNFGQALAYACKLLGKRCTVVMPDNSAAVKIDAVREFGGEVELVDTKKTSRAARVDQLHEQFAAASARPDDVLAVSAYDDDLVIEGNASLGRELAAVTPAFDAVLVPVGGGGLSSGIIKGLRAEDNTTTAVYGVEPAIANDCARSLQLGSIQSNESEPQTIADGVRTVSIGKTNWKYLQHGLAGLIEVSEEQIKEAMRMLFLLANIKAEPTGAVALAGALAYGEQLRGKRVCCVVSGGNVDSQVFHSIVCHSATDS